jgi:hypothetical protein
MGKSVCFSNYLKWFGLFLFQYQIADGETFINANRVIVHPNYNPRTLNNDFALIRLASPAPLSSFISIACLPPNVNQVISCQFNEKLLF